MLGQPALGRSQVLSESSWSAQLRRVCRYGQRLYQQSAPSSHKRYSKAADTYHLDVAASFCLPPTHSAFAPCTAVCCVACLRCEFEDGVNDVLVLLESLDSLGAAAVGLVHHCRDLVRVQTALVRSLARLLLLLLLLRRSSLSRSSTLHTHRHMPHKHRVHTKHNR